MHGGPFEFGNGTLLLANDVIRPRLVEKKLLETYYGSFLVKYVFCVWVVTELEGRAINDKDE